MLGIIGLGYVGLPIALAFAKKSKVIGFDINAARIAQLAKHQDPDKELGAADFADTDIHFTADPADLASVDFFIIAVPTPIDQHNIPDLRALKAASKTVAPYLKKGSIVVFESTVYPGCTEEICLPILEAGSGLSLGEFGLGYSPERINPGDKKHTLATIVKVVSGHSEDVLEQVAEKYALVVEAGIHKAPSIKVAEAAKVIENAQRDLNIAFMNELSCIFQRLDINTYEVLEAAGTKWNFLPFYPGLVGGHCIGVDPFYLTYKAEAVGYHPQVILSGRKINDDMAGIAARQVIQEVVRKGKAPSQCKCLILGGTFKENVTDIRNSKVVDMVREFQSFSIDTTLVDPYDDANAYHKMYGLELVNELPTVGSYDVFVLAVSHQQFVDLPVSVLEGIAAEQAILADLKGIYRHRDTSLQYWSL